MRVDLETGQTTVERFIACHDVGRAINPVSVEGQISGGVVQGIGMALMEEVVMDSGVMLTTNFRDYLIPTSVDVPPIEAVIVERDDPTGPYGAKGVGEPPVVASVAAVVSGTSIAVEECAASLCDTAYTHNERSILHIPGLPHAEHSRCSSGSESYGMLCPLRICSRGMTRLRSYLGTEIAQDDYDDNAVYSAYCFQHHSLCF